MGTFEIIVYIIVYILLVAFIIFLIVYGVQVNSFNTYGIRRRVQTSAPTTTTDNLWNGGNLLYISTNTSKLTLNLSTKSNNIGTEFAIFNGGSADILLNAGGLQGTSVGFVELLPPGSYSGYVYVGGTSILQLF